MNKTILFLALSLCCSVARAQVYDKVVEQSVWTQSLNATFVADGKVNASEAQIYSNYQGGGFITPGQGTSLMTNGVLTRGIHHEKNFSMAGSFSFLQRDGKNMYGSMYLHPEKYPIDAIEYTPGDKTLQTYSFNGELAVNITDNLRLGARMDFSSSNYSKRKDLRYVNYVLDYTLSPSVLYHTDALSLGANFIFCKDSESMTAEQIGSATTYNAFLNKGLWFGVDQLWTGNGVHLNESGVQGLPLGNTGYGMGLQIASGGLFAGAQMLYKKGTAGEKQSIWFRFPGWEFSASAGWKMLGASDSHILKAEFVHSSTVNNESILEKVTQGGITTTVELGSNLLSQIQKSSLNLSYNYFSKVLDLYAAFGADSRQELLTVTYPYICYRNLSSVSALVGSSLTLGRVRASLRLAYAQGSCNETQRIASEHSGITDTVYRLDSWNQAYLEYQTCPKLMPELSIQYLLSKGLYLGLEGNAVKAWNLEYIESGLRYLGGLRLIYNF